MQSDLESDGGCQRRFIGQIRVGFGTCLYPIINFCLFSVRQIDTVIDRRHRFVQITGRNQLEQMAFRRIAGHYQLRYLLIIGERGSDGTAVACGRRTVAANNIQHTLFNNEVIYIGYIIGLGYQGRVIKGENTVLSGVSTRALDTNLAFTPSLVHCVAVRVMPAANVAYNHAFPKYCFDMSIWFDVIWKKCSRTAVRCLHTLFTKCCNSAMTKT